MKIRTVLATAFGVGVGYVLGARAGRDKFDEMKSQAQRLVNDPDVRQKVADLPNQVRENLPKAQAKVSETIKGATDKVQSATDSDSSSAADTATLPDPMIVSEPAVVPEPVVVGDPGLAAGESSLGESDLLADADLLTEPADLPTSTGLPLVTDLPESSDTFEVSSIGEVTETNAFDSGEVSGLEPAPAGDHEFGSTTTSDFDPPKHV